MLPKVTIIILNWNGKEDTIECLESLKHITYPNYKILLLDNGSTDGSIECFRERYPDIEIIENGENLGFAEGNNVGMRKVMEEDADYVLLLNNDTLVDENFLIELVSVAESDPKIGVVGPKIYFPESNIIWYAGGKIDLKHASLDVTGFNNFDSGQHNSVKSVEWMTGCAFLIKNEVMEKVGLFDPIFFAYWEEIDWCIKIRKAGYEIDFVPTAIIWHKQHSSTKNIGGFRNYLILRNSILCLRKYGNLYDKIYFVVWFTCYKFPRLFIGAIIRRNFNLAKCYLKALSWHLKIIDVG